MTKSLLKSIYLFIVLATLVAACSPSPVTQPTAESISTPSPSPNAFVTTPTGKIDQAVTSPSPQTGSTEVVETVYTQARAGYVPPFEITFNPLVWDYRRIDPNNHLSDKVLFSRQFPTCFFEAGVMTHPDYLTSEYFEIDGRDFRVRKYAGAREMFDSSNLSVFEITYPGIENIEATPNSFARYNNFWKFMLTAQANEIEGCLPLALDLLANLETKTKPTATPLPNPQATLRYYVGKIEGYEIWFSYPDADWVRHKESMAHSVLFSRAVPSCSFWANNFLPNWNSEVSGMRQFKIDGDVYYQSPEVIEPSFLEVKVVLYSPTLEQWIIEVYAPENQMENCLTAVKEVLLRRELIPIDQN